LTCASMCDAIQSYMASNHLLPPFSDVGCTYVDDEVCCNVDLRQPQLASLVTNREDMPDFHEGEVAAKKKEIMMQNSRGLHEKDANSAFDRIVARENRFNELLQEKGQIDYRLWIITRRLANLFRIYPVPHRVAPNKHESLIQAMSRGGNGTSDPQPYVPPAFSGNWRDGVAKTMVKAQAVLSWAIRLFHARDTKKSITTWFGKDAYTHDGIRKELNRVMNAVDNMLSNVIFAYGDDFCGDTPDEDSHIYAFVAPFPDPSEGSIDKCNGTYPQTNEVCVKNRDQQFVFYLCNTYMNATEQEQIETMLHEGSHHGTAFTNDVCMNEFFRDSDPRVYARQVPLSSVEGHFFYDNNRSVHIKFEDMADLDIDYLMASGLYVVNETTSTFEGTLVHRFENRAVVQLKRSDEDKDDDNCEDDHAMPAYGRGLCKVLARLSPFYAVKNADNVCYYLFDIMSNHGVTKFSYEPCEGAGATGFCIGQRVVYLGDDIYMDGRNITAGEKGQIIFSASNFRIQMADDDADFCVDLEPGEAHVRFDGTPSSGSITVPVKSGFLQCENMRDCDHSTGLLQRICGNESKGNGSKGEFKSDSFLYSLHVVAGTLLGQLALFKLF